MLSASAPSKLRVLSLDFGAELVKVAGLVSGSSKFEIIEDAHSQRYTAAGLCLLPKTGHRQLGNFFQSCAIRNPLLAFPHLPRLVGLQFTDPFVQWYCANVNASLRPDPVRNTVTLLLEGSNRLVPVEEALAMLIDFLVQPFGEALPGSCVVALPACYGPFAREAIVQACAIAGLVVNEVVVDLDAAALEYALYSSGNAASDKKKRVLFIDAGASHVSACAVELQQQSQKNGGSSIKILDRESSEIGLGGGIFFTHRIMHALVKPALLQQSGLADLAPAVLLRLLPAVEKAKKELNGLEQRPISIEINDKIYTVMIDRKAVRECCKDLFDQMIAPIEALIARSEAGNAESFDSMIPLGKGSKLFLFEEWAAQKFGSKVATVMNQEEAVAKGAGLSASILFNAFRLGQKVSLEALFLRGAELKCLIGDESVALEWGKSIEVEKSVDQFSVVLDSRPFLQVNLGPVAEVAKEAKESKEPKEAKEGEEAKEGVDSKNADATATTQSATTESTESTTTATSVTFHLTAGWKVKCSSPSRTCSIQNIPGPYALTGAEMTLSQQTLAQLKASELELFNYSKTKSELEASIYNYHSYLDPISPFISSSQKSSLEKILKKAEAHLNSAKSTFESLRKEKSKIEKAFEPVLHREAESNVRPEVLDQANQAIEASKKKLAEYESLFEQNSTLVGSLTLAEVAEARVKVGEFERWIEANVKKQAKKALHEDPFFEVQDVQKKIKLLKEEGERCKRLVFTPRKVETAPKEAEKEVNESAKAGSDADSNVDAQEKHDAEEKPNVEGNNNTNGPANNSTNDTANNSTDSETETNANTQTSAQAHEKAQTPPDSSSHSTHPIEDRSEL